jgi:TDG/mug DNA glycosylase family protein
MEEGMDPIVNDSTSILILGSMPGVKSLEAREYYAHPQNNFWRFIEEIFKKERLEPYDEKKKFLLSKGIGLWDVIKSCKRLGSLDSKIDSSSIKVNDFENFLNKNPNIKKICFNGQKAHKTFKKYFPNSFSNIAEFTLPSTSPANAGISKEKKVESWKEAILVA